MGPTDARGGIHRIPPNSCSRILPGKRKKRARHDQNPAGIPREANLSGTSSAQPHGNNAQPHGNSAQPHGNSAQPRASSAQPRAGCRRPRRLGAPWLLTLALVAFAAAPAFAENEPQLITTFPAFDGSERSMNVDRVTATYDRDISGFKSSLVVRDNANNVLVGETDLAGPLSETGGKRTIRFTPFAPLSEAASPYTARAEAWPLAPGEPDLAIWHFEIDDTAPAAPLITDPSNGDVRDDQPLLALGTTEPGAYISIIESTATIALERANLAGDFSIALPYPPEDGVAHTITAVAEDRAGNRSADSAPVSFIHDSIEVVPVIVTPSQGQHLNTGSVLVSGTAKPGATVTIREGGPAIGVAGVNPSGNWSVTLPFTEATHVITAEAFDGVNVDGPSPARTFTVDLTAPPVPIITTPAPGAALASHDVTVSGTAEQNTSVRIREGSLLRATVPVDGAGAWSASITFTSGSHTITATGEDRAGNLSAQSAPRTFSVDTADPAAPTITQPAQSAFLASNVVTVGGSAEANAGVRVLEGTVTIGVATADNAGSWSVMISFADGAHTIHAVTVDDAGNVSPLSAGRAFTVDTLAPAAPVITHPGPGEVVGPQVFVAGTAEPGTTVEIREGVTLVGSAAADGAGNWSLTITFGAGGHTITARAVDLAGNISPPSGARTFTVSSSVDVVPPPAPTIIDPAAGAIVGPVPVFRGGTEAGATVTVYEGLAVVGTATAGPSGSWEFAVNMPAGSHTVTATATDPAGNTGPSSPSRTFTVDASRPTVSFSTAGPVIVLPGQTVTLSGTASDNFGVAGVTVEVLNSLTGVRALLVAAACTGCPGTPVSWQSSPSLGPGLWTARALSADLAGNRSSAAEIELLVL
ncbi:MAG TPA: Ig-like domain-containing protein [Actinomycetota bacterium]